MTTAQLIVNRLLEDAETQLGTVTLRELGITTPDDSELIWNFIVEDDLDTPFPVHTVSPEALKAIEINGESLTDTYEQNSTSRQRKLVDRYVKALKAEKLSAQEKTIIFSGDMLLDGHHRAVAAILANKPLLFINIAEPK